ncbi:hypothetical protein V8B55DRAFT_1455850 [Mucor lusitanicus]|uniref:Uncharacterized protein n=2 Tax=Mucor circinelloides f. lusitanicus TaxID=29924 RepID=A0A162Z2A5_MUCCL|nr:hypothetical protein FB192DRAFT_1349982 [Mucor lusitanicus]OAD01977.1 hypothetical protein MUCCIDRAFT_163925 [Mucor lusitanicus CBS 277.49]
MMNRKTKRNSPPPLHTTTAAVLDHKLTESGFAKWSKVLQLISPPNKKRRAVALIGQSCENSSDEDEDQDESEQGESDDDDDHQEIIVKRAQRPDSMNKQKMLNRRAMYIPNPVQQQHYNDGPKDAWHKWALYLSTQHKLRRNSLPLSEGLHLRRMLVHLQQDESIQDHIQQQHKMPAHRYHSNNDDEDNIPLGTLLENKKLATAVPPVRCSSPPLPLRMTAAANKPKAFYQRMVVTPPPAALNLFYRQPCYYYNNMQSFPVQFL